MRTPRGWLLALGLLVPLAAYAANPHFQSGPTFTVSNDRLQTCGSLAGLGNQDVTIQVDATVDVQCVNRGGNPPPGQRETTSGTVTRLRPENGHLDFCVTTDTPASPCPKSMKIQTTFVNATITVSQGGQVVFRQSYQI